MRMLIFLFVFGLVSISIKAQTLKKDSIELIAKIDAYKFRLNQSDLKSFKRNGRKSTSDLFKPNKENVSDSTLLHDSVYVKKYRAITFKKTLKRHNVAYYAFLGVGAYAAVILGTLILLATGTLQMP